MTFDFISARDGELELQVVERGPPDEDVASLMAAGEVRHLLWSLGTQPMRAGQSQRMT